VTDAGSAWSSVDHYENFPVGSWLVPRRLRHGMRAIYRIARYADDVADEGEAAPQARLAELARLDAALRALQDGAAPDHPVIAASAAAIAAHGLDPDRFRALLSAFAQDVTTPRYADDAMLDDYCLRSAAPVGHLVLQLFGGDTPRQRPRADAICVALQRINFLQDVAIDWAKDRVYLPATALAAEGLSADAVGEDVRAGRARPALRAVIAAQAALAGRLLESGRSLALDVPMRLGWELRLVCAGGARILERLALAGHDPIAQRPTLGRPDAWALLRLALRGVDPAAPATALPR